MVDITAGNTSTFTLAAGQELYVKTTGTAVIKYGRDVESAPSVVSLSSSDGELRYGPLAVPMLFTVTSTTGTATYANEASQIKQLPDDGSEMVATVNAIADAVYGKTGGMSPTEFGEAIRNGQVKTSIAALQALTGMTAGQVVKLSDGGRSGDFEYVLGDFSAEVAADTLNGVYIKLDSISASVGALRRVLNAGFVTIEQMGYDGTNAQVCIYNAAALGLTIVGDEKSYVFSDTIFIPKNGIVLKSASGKIGGFILQAASGMSKSKLLIDAENYDYLYANSVTVSNPSNPADIASPKSIALLGVRVSGNYDSSYLPSPAQGDGIGVRLYGRQIRVDIEVSNTENCGLITYFPLTDGGIVAGDDSGLPAKQSEISVRTSNTGREGFVFDGPADSVLVDIVCRDASASNHSLQSVTPVDSVEYPGDAEKLCPAIDIRKSCHHKGFMNGFGTRNGWSTYISNNRFQSSGIVQVDSSDGGIAVPSGAWAQLALLEVHGLTYGFITHSGGLRPAIKSQSVQGFLCPAVKVNLGGDWSDRPIADIGGVGCMANINIAPIYSDAPTNIGALLAISGREHDVTLSTSGSLSGSSNKGVVFGDLTKSKVKAQLHLLGSTIADFSGMTAGVDKTNHIDIIGVSSSGNVPSSISGLSTLTSQDLKNTNVTVNSSSLTKDYGLKTVAYSSAVAISAGSTSTSVTHNYLGTPNISDISVEFIPESTATIMPDITGVQITGITGFSVTVAYTMSGGSGNMNLRVKVSA